MKAINYSLMLLITGSLIACSQPTITSQSAITPQIIEVAKPVYTTDSYVLAEALPNKKLRVSITAKDKSLYIVNCNQSIDVSLYALSQPELIWGGSDACLSPNIIIPKGVTLSLEITIKGERKPIDFTSNYNIVVHSIYETPDFPNAIPVAYEKVTSNTFKLLP